jgi:hypothetical protein
MQAHSHSTRQKAYEMWKTGEKRSQISRLLKVDYDTLLIWCKRFSESKEDGLQLQYKNCGRKTDLENPIRKRAIELRILNSDWGAEYIRLNLEREFQGQRIVQPKQIRIWLSQADLQIRKTKLPPVKAEWTTKPMERVQVDAKERLKTKDGKDCCYLNYIDENTGAALDAFVFPLCKNQSSSNQGSL